MILHQPGNVPVREVVLHCAAIKAGQFDGYTPFQAYSTINRWHVERGWRGFGYHGLFMPDGTFYTGRPWSNQGAHVAGRNLGTLGLLLIESAEIKRMGEFADYFTPAQRVALRAVIAALRTVHTVTGHNDHDSGKLCPGFQVHQSDWL